MIDLTNEKNSIKNISTLVDRELSSIVSSLSCQNNLNFQLLDILKKFISENSDSVKVHNTLADVNKILKKSNLNISYIKKLLSKLKKVKKLITDNISISDIIKQIEEFNLIYNSYFEKIFENTLSIESFIDVSTTQTIEDILEDVFEDLTNSIIVPEIELSEEAPNLYSMAFDDLSPTYTIKENTLVISEIEKKIILPYLLDDLNQILDDNGTKYSSIREIIDSKYTLPISYFKNPIVARFKEAFNLIKEKEHGSIKDAIELGLELSTNYNLHPAIITACKNITELDIYLSCLEYNELDDFQFFKIEFIAPPAVVSTHKISNLFNKLLGKKDDNKI